MNNKLLIGVLTIIVVIAVISILLSKQPNNSNTSVPTQVQPSQSPAANPPVAVISESIVNITSKGFEPKTLTIGVDTTVTWINKSGSVVSINSDPHPVHTAYPPLNLGTVDDSKSVSLIFDKPGTYGYHNHLQPSQKGTIIVQ